MSTENQFATTNAVVLAGGLGTRLRSEVSDRSKVVADVGQRPFITRLFDQLIGVGVKKAILCTGFKAEGVQELLGNRYQSLELVYSPEPSPLGTAGALRLAIPLMESPTLFVLNGDSYFTGNLLSFMDFHITNAASASIMLSYMNSIADYGQVKISKDGRIETFDEKRGIDEPGWVNAGLYLLSKEWIKSIPNGRNVSLEAEMFPAWIGQAFYGFQAEGTLLDIGTPERYRQAADFFKALDE